MSSSLDRQQDAHMAARPGPPYTAAAGRILILIYVKGVAY
jgi:hypothetical protein